MSSAIDPYIEKSLIRLSFVYLHIKGHELFFLTLIVLSRIDKQKITSIAYLYVYLYVHLCRVEIGINYGLTGYYTCMRTGQCRYV